PPLGEDDEVDIGGAWSLRRRGHDGEDRWIGMIEQQGAHRGEAPQVVFVRRVIAVPGDDIERRLADLGRVELAAPFHEKRRGLLLILVRCDWSKKVARIGEAICPDRPAIGTREGAGVVLAHIGARWAIDEFDSTPPRAPQAHYGGSPGRPCDSAPNA